MAYELFYAFATTSTRFELLCFIIWFLFDVAFVTVVLVAAYPRHRWYTVTCRLILGVVAGVAFLIWLCSIFPDERQQVTAFWTGVVLQFPISIGSMYLLIAERSTKGHSLEIWITRCLGCWTAYGLFFWRWWNIPQNWAYVGSFWSVTLIGLTLAAEAVYPIIYIRVWSDESRKSKTS
jgi:hypothetical protein